ncbi:MAG: hypothetical protein GXO91_05500 [FCB group bacterium]|nr:hypothetical protein [FCB group bacterium]
MKTYLLIIGLFFHLLLPQDEPSLSATIVVDAKTGWPVKVLVTGYAPQAVVWLGISLYPYNTRDPEEDGTHRTVRITDHLISMEIPIEEKFLDGSFEVALWEKQVDKVDCTLDYCYWCKRFGRHSEGMLAYSSGLLTRLNGYSK